MSNHERQHRTPANPSWIWSGVHGDSGIVHPFIATRDDPYKLYHRRVNHPGNMIVAGSGGLLLIKWSFPGSDTLTHDEGSDTLTDDEGSDALTDDEGSDTLGDDEDSDTHRTSPIHFRRFHCAEAEDQSTITPVADQGQPSVGVGQQWQSLLVLNPSTEESRVLPPANSMDVGMEVWSYQGVQAHLLVDTESQTYTVTLTFPYCVCLYSSTSNAWRCRRFNQGASWGPQNRELSANAWKRQIASAHVNGRLFFADVVVEDSIPTMNLIEIDVEAGSWKLHNWRYPLRTQLTEFLDTPFLRMRGLTDHAMHQALHTRTLASRNSDCVPDSVLGLFQMVECMGELYAVIPMSTSEYLPMSLRSRRTWTEVLDEYPNFGLSFMPLQFLIVNMRGDGFVHGALRIVLPEDVRSVIESEGEDDIESEGEDDNESEGEDDNESEGVDDNETRQNDLLDWLGFFGTELLGEFRWEFSCMAEGSVIWVALKDYVLQYDVLTGVSKTEIVGECPEEMSLQVWLDRVPYRPSAVKP